MATGLFNLKQVNQAIQQGAWATGAKPTAVDYLVVAGGGGSGYNWGSPGGAGGLLQGGVPVASGTSITVTVGAGGTSWSNGSNSVFGSIASTGGGAGGGGTTTAYSGGSGGGASVGAGGNGYGFGLGIPGQGNNGGRGWTGGGGATGNASGGGGGAGTKGADVYAAGYGALGGSGVASAITGTVTTYAGGGNGSGNYGANSDTTGGRTASGTAGAANTGSGAGSGDYIAGGSGVVIISYPDVYAAPTATTGSPTVSTSGSGSISFNGSTQFVAYPSNAAFNLGSSNFTIEFWVYRSASGTQVFAGQNNSSLGARVFDIGIDGSNNFNGEVYVGATSYTVSSSTTMNISTWYHVALVRNSTVLTLYVNGTSVGTITVAGSVTAGSTPITVGRVGDYSSAYYLNGYVSNFRYVVGTALYTGNFTPSTTPLTAVSGTQLLLNSVSGAYLADGSTNSFAPASTTVAGGWNQLSPFTGTGYKNRVYTWTSSGSITF